MTDYSIDDALSGFKTVLADIDPAPEAAPANIYAWPADNANLDLTDFPFIICAQALNRPFGFAWQTQGSGIHTWNAELLVCLGNGPLTRAEAAAAGIADQEPWILAMAKILFKNRGVNGTALDIGTPGSDLFTYRVGHIGWDKNHVFWGLRFEVPVMQENALPVL